MGLERPATNHSSRKGVAAVSEQITFLLTTVLSAVVHSCFSENIPSSLFNTVEIVLSTDCSTSAAAILIVVENASKARRIHPTS